MYDKVISLPFETSESIIKENGVEVYILRPEKPSPNLKQSYNKNDNFQVWLRIEDKRSEPEHKDYFDDLYSRVRSNSHLIEKYDSLFENIFYGGDPVVLSREIQEDLLDGVSYNLIICAVCAQLFIIEQDVNRKNNSLYNPPSLFFMGYLRSVLDLNTNYELLLTNSFKDGRHFSVLPNIKYTYIDNSKLYSGRI